MSLPEALRALKAGDTIVTDTGWRYELDHDEPEYFLDTVGLSSDHNAYWDKETGEARSSGACLLGSIIEVIPAPEPEKKSLAELHLSAIRQATWNALDSKLSPSYTGKILQLVGDYADAIRAEERAKAGPVVVALRGVIAISDRKHNAWDKAKDALAAYEREA